jgi:hypothetical protein
LEELGVDVKTVLKNVKEIEWNDIDWIDVAQDKDRRRDVVNEILDLRISWLGKDLL